MSLAILALAALMQAQTAPPGQEFNFSSMFDMSTNRVRWYLGRTVKTSPRRVNEQARTFPPYRWSVSQSGAHLRFLPVSGQTTEPKIIALSTSIPAPKTPYPDVSFNGGQVETTSCEYRVDWSGCRPGFYQMQAHAAIVGESRTWTMIFDHQVFYWRPLKPPTDILAKGQPYLLMDRTPRRVTLGDPATAHDLYATTLTIENVGKTVQWQTPVRLRATKTGASISTTFPHLDNVPGLTPVYVDGEVRQLRRRYIGKTVYPMGLYLAVQEDSYGNHLVPVKRGEAAIVIRDIWRGARPGQLGNIDPTITGDHQFFLTGWYPIYVVFDIKTPDLVMPYEHNLNKSGHLIAVLPDAWAFDRQFSLTSKKEDFPQWKPHPNGFKEPIFPEPGMTPKQLAWLRSWPIFVGSMSETVALKEWRYEPYQSPPATFRFEKGRLLMGSGVVKY